MLPKVPLQFLLLLFWLTYNHFFESATATETNKNNINCPCIHENDEICQFLVHAKCQVVADTACGIHSGFACSTCPSFPSSNSLLFTCQDECESLQLSGCQSIIVIPKNNNDNNDSSCGFDFICNNDNKNDHPANCPLPTEPCMDFESYQSCRQLALGGCQSIAYLESCPLQFACEDENNKDDNSSTACPQVSEPCMNENNYQQCRQLELGGCNDIAVLESCPLQFACEDENNNDKDDNSSTACPQLSEPCMNENNYQQCRQLELGGCNDIAVLESCPLQFACQDDTTTVVSSQLATPTSKFTMHFILDSQMVCSIPICHDAIDESCLEQDAVFETTIVTSSEHFCVLPDTATSGGLKVKTVALLVAFVLVGSFFGTIYYYM